MEPARMVLSIIFLAAKNSKIVQIMRIQLCLELNLGKRNAWHVKYKQNTSIVIHANETAYSITAILSKVKTCFYTPRDTCFQRAIQIYSGAKQYYWRAFLCTSYLQESSYVSAKNLVLSVRALCLQALCSRCIYDRYLEALR